MLSRLTSTELLVVTILIKRGAGPKPAKLVTLTCTTVKVKSVGGKGNVATSSASHTESEGHNWMAA
jgi:hypothetical protein